MCDFLITMLFSGNRAEGRRLCPVGCSCRSIASGQERSLYARSLDTGHDTTLENSQFGGCNEPEQNENDVYYPYTHRRPPVTPAAY
jgi:hypothetical protein